MPTAKGHRGVSSKSHQGHGDNVIIEENMTNPIRDMQKYGDKSGEEMKGGYAWALRFLLRGFPPLLSRCS